ncbi:sulfur carrier protein ThiS [Deferribacter autotrophicus]|uniref:Sulfur carrier protein ThiS n=1 Tax=Deferribacter autotrophicus TaxID=500465 RepID=A0A5A8F044_9BACT|nr:sulfur carrier protein ThiS [Deferribacter autotrophicus]KAA0257162.1 sulfur carrier protein ThiS [Deferribacter autotrophicus]
MKLKVNGEEVIVKEEKLTVAELLKIKKVEDPDTVVVQLNGEFLDKSKYNNTLLKEKDEVDFLYFVGGGLI